MTEKEQKKEINLQELHSNCYEITQFERSKQTPHDCFYVSELLAYS